ncbi:MAG TPA: V-type ATPase subunit [Sedimentisphaerales bacterium]|nr:V-type ATPase subunit [Sedimentisphaerales bacterium]
MPEIAKQAILDFYTYPPIGGDDWRYVFETAQVRTLEIAMLSRAALQDMANADGFAQASELLSGTEYAVGSTGDFGRVENMLGERRTAIRELFAELMRDAPIVELVKSRDDFANLRLALRRVLTGKPLGGDYSPDGNASPDVFSSVFEEERYDLLPDYMRQAVDAAVLAYYEKKDVRQIDYAIDAVQAEYNLKRARRLGSIFLTGLFRIRIDLTNIRTMLRLKFTGDEKRNVFLEGGYVEQERFGHGLDLGYEALAPLFFVTPYHRVVEAGAAYVASNKSFLKLEQQCDEHLTGFLKSTIQVTAGPQPIIAYLLMKEHEIRTVRLILTAKRNSLDTKLILDRIA